MKRSKENIDLKINGILTKVKYTVLSIEPDAEIYLFGSRARGDYQKDSDWDLLILLDGEANYERERLIIHFLFDIEVEYRQIFNIIIHTKKDWYKDRFYRAAPFYIEVSKEIVAV